MTAMKNSKYPDISLGQSIINVNIFFGPEIWPLQSQGGISRYNAELIKGMSSINQNTFAFLPENRNQFIDLVPDQSKILTNQTKTSDLIETALKKIKKENHNSIYHATYFGNTELKLWQRAGFKTVITVHDLISEKFPEKKILIRPRINLKQKAIRLADHIICISQTTKIDLINYYDIDENKISVVYHGSDLRESESEFIHQAEKGKFLLYVGKRGGYKNFDSFLKAFAKSDQLKNSFKIIAFGGGNFTERELEFLNELGIRNSVLQLSGNDKELIQLYSTAFAFVYPSLYEGFGLPPIEAMQYGCPVLASDRGSIPEICNDAAIYFDPTSIDSMVLVMEESLKEIELLDRKRALGYINAKKYTWQKTTLETADVYINLLS